MLARLKVTHLNAYADASDLGPGERVWSLIRGSIEVLCTDPKSVALLLRLRGTAIPQEWPTTEDLGIDLSQFDFSNAE